MIGACAVFLGFQGNKWLKSGLRRRRRYRRHVPADLNRSLPTLRPLRDRLLGWAMALTGVPLFILWGVVGFFGLLLFTILLFAHGAVPHWLSWMENDLHPEWQLLYQHPYMEMQWWGVEYLAVVAFGWFLFRQGSRKLWPHRFAARPGGLRIPGTDHWRPVLRAVIALLCGVVMLVVAASGFLALRTCAAGWHGGRPNWINWGMVSYRFVDVCEMTYQKKLSWDEVTLGLAALSAFVFSIVLLYSGIVELAALFRERRLSMSKDRAETVYACRCWMRGPDCRRDGDHGSFDIVRVCGPGECRRGKHKPHLRVTMRVRCGLGGRWGITRRFCTPKTEAHGRSKTEGIEATSTR